MYSTIQQWFSLYARRCLFYQSFCKSFSIVIQESCFLIKPYLECVFRLSGCARSLNSGPGIVPSPCIFIFLQIVDPAHIINKATGCWRRHAAIQCFESRTFLFNFQPSSLLDPSPKFIRFLGGHLSFVCFIALPMVRACSRRWISFILTGELSMPFYLLYPQYSNFSPKSIHCSHTLHEYIAARFVSSVFSAIWETKRLPYAIAFQ